MKKLRLLSFIFCLLSAILPSEACTSFLVGRKASTDGSAFITYNMDSYGMYAELNYFPAAKYPKGTMRRIVDGDTKRFMGEIAEAEQTYAVMGYINEFQLSIMETTFGGREELIDTTGIIDYPSLMTLALQRAKTAREAIEVMTSLVNEYGYAGSGESFSIADPNEVWILEMIGKGSDRKGCVWVAVRIPDDAIACHANHSRIHKFDLKDKKNVLYAKDVISFAREKGYFDGKDEEFDFSAAYAPADFSAIRYCEARVWSFYNRWAEGGMADYLDYADGHHIGTAEPLPLYIKPKRKLSLQDVIDSNRDHFEGTPFDVTKDCGAGNWAMPYRPSPLTWKYEGKTYFNERPISTQQSACTMVAQMRGWLPNAIGGVLWFGNDDPNMVAYTPVYCGATKSPKCYNAPNSGDATFSWESAFWVCNWVANMTYPRYSQIMPAVAQVRDRIEKGCINRQPEVEQKALALYKQAPEKAQHFLTKYSSRVAQNMLREWKQLGEYIIVKFNDMVVKKEENGEFLRTPDGIIVGVERPGLSEDQKRNIVKETGSKFAVPE